jgi:hypothetical protein
VGRHRGPGGMRAFSARRHRRSFGEKGDDARAHNFLRTARDAAELSSA